MKIILLTCLVTYAFADVSHLKLERQDPKDEATAKIVGQTYDSSPDGTSYEWSLETSNGINAKEQGQLSGGENPAVGVQGLASWTAPDGEPVSFSYVADDSGYHPQGSHLPTPPPIPEEILRALEYIRQHPPPKEN